MQKNNSEVAFSPQLNSIWLEYQKLWQDQSRQAWAHHPEKQKSVDKQIQGSIFATFLYFGELRLKWEYTEHQQLLSVVRRKWAAM